MKFQHFNSQHLGKRIITEIAKEIAKFHSFSSDKFGAHSFRRSKATNLVEGGVTPQQLMSAGS
jgi:site-specific recombinase XerD